MIIRRHGGGCAANGEHFSLKEIFWLISPLLVIGIFLLMIFFNEQYTQYKRNQKTVIDINHITISLATEQK